jgi:drug/metabolite transporter (DMT)-like permease
VIQEVITLTVFAVFAWLVLREKLTWYYAVSFGLVVAAVYFATAFAPPASETRSQATARGLTPPLKGTAYVRSAHERM